MSRPPLNRKNFSRHLNRVFADGQALALPWRRKGQ
jgi:hypothetical protein